MTEGATPPTLGSRTRYMFAVVLGLLTMGSLVYLIAEATR